MEYIIVCIVSIALELGTVRLINKREPNLLLDYRKYGGLIAAGNIIFMIMAVWLQTGENHFAIWHFGLLSYLFCLSIYDIRFKELPDYFHFIPVLFYGYLFLRKQLPYTVTQGLLAVLVVGLLLIIVYLIRKDAIGVGDIKVAMLCAQYTAGMIFGILLRAMVAAFICSLVLLVLKKVTTKSGLPFIPFILVGALFL
ncbi:MAG: prepilin peptidase [Lachnospiraceae bacterium]|nr:prepilin peptidase [Lachnospiraceae bacterium]